MGKIYKYGQWLNFLNRIPKPAQDDFIRQSLKDKANLHIFGVYFFPHIIKSPDIPEYQIELNGFFAAPGHGAAIEPRGHGKTTWERIDAIHDIVYALEPVLIFYGNTATDAQFHLEAIKQELESNERLLRVFGDLVPVNASKSKKWTNRHIQTNNGINMLARGAGKGRGVNIRGQRPTKVLLDDIEDDQTVRNPDRRRKLHDWIYQVVYPMVDKKRGRIKMVGTVLSLNAEVLAFYKKFGGVFRKAIEKGRPLWPQLYSLMDLYKVKSDVGSRVFAQEYQNTPVNDETSVIKRNWLENNFYSTIVPLSLKMVLMFDPQAGEKEGSDYYGLSLVGFYPNDKHRYVIAALKGKASQREQAALIVRTWQQNKNKIIVVGIEKIMTQVAVLQNVLEWKSGIGELPDVDNKDRNIPVIAVNPQGKDKVSRLQMHEAAFERNEIHLHQSLKDFADELIAFPDVEHDDRVDAMIYALDYSYKTGLSKISESSYTADGGNTTSGLANKKF